MSSENLLSGSIDGLVYIISIGLILFFVFLTIKRISGKRRLEMTSGTVPPLDDPYLSSGYLRPAGWIKDPSGKFDMRYWDGDTWTNRVKAIRKPNKSSSISRSIGSTTDLKSEESKSSNLISSFERLAKLHQDGIITAEEFSQTKKRIIDSF